MNEVPPSGRRHAEAARKDPERDVRVVLSLDGRGACSGSSGFAQLDRMLSVLARHGFLDLSVECVADPVFDRVALSSRCGECVGEALSLALGDRRGTARIGSQAAPLEEALVRVAVDLTGRPHLAWRVPKLKAEGVDPLALFRFLQGLTLGAALTAHVDLLAPGATPHVFQAVFRALGAALRQAAELRPLGPPPVDPAGDLG